MSITMVGINGHGSDRACTEERALEEPTMSDKSAALAVATGDSPVTLKGTTNGFEIRVDSHASLDTISSEIAAKLEQAPAFFSGGDVTIRFDDRPPRGYLGPIEEVTGRFDLRIVSVCGPEDDAGNSSSEREMVEPAVEPILAVGSEPLRPLAGDSKDERHAAVVDEPQVSMPSIPAPKMIVGPVRSGCVLEVEGHLIIIGDVNPGAEVRAAGSIVVLGRLRGIAHAGVEGGAAFILALELEPQQLRVGELVARAGDSEKRPEKAEIAFAREGQIHVEHYAGRLPWGIATAKF